MRGDNRVHSFRERPEHDPTRKPEDFDPGGEVWHGEPDWRRRVPDPTGRNSIAQGLYGNYGPRAFHNGVGGGLGAFGVPPRVQRDSVRLREDICERLTHDGDIDATDIEVKVDGGFVILEGQVNSRAEKWRAEDCALSIPGVQDVQNNLHVRQHEHHTKESWMDRSW